MRRLAYFFLLTSACGQTQVPPTVRDTYVLTGNPRVVSLKDNLNVVVCKAEYDAWRKNQKSAPALSLYMNGMLMKGPEAVRPVSAPDKPGDKITDNVKADCMKQSDDAVAAAEKDAADKASAAKEAAGKAAVNEPDANKKAAAAKDASDKDVSAKDAAKTAADVKAAAQQRYVMMYYLDSQFVMKPETKEPWLRLLERPWQSESVTVSVGPADGSPWPSVAAIPFERINLGWLIGWAALFVIAIILFVKYARQSDIIRDPGELPAPPPGTPARMKAYSLARTQMAVWTFLVAGALAFLFLVTWNENTISSEVLVLLGISFGTTLMAATADQVSPTPAEVTLAEKDAADKAAAAEEAAKKAAAETDVAKKPVADKEAADKAFAAKYAADKVASLKAGISQIPQPTKGLLADLLTEA